MKREEALQNAKPILFNTDMVRAILDGRKTVTRRVVKISREKVYKSACAFGKWAETYREIPDHLIEWYAKERAKAPCCVGDILYVRETWRKLRFMPPDDKAIPAFICLGCMVGTYPTSLYMTSRKTSTNFKFKSRRSRGVM